MRRHLVLVGSSLLVLANATGVAAAHDDEDDDGHHGDRDPVVVATGLDNPRQLNWLGNDVLVAEGGAGGEPCPVVPALSCGSTGQISAIDRPFRTHEGEAMTLVDGLFSVLIPDTGAVGSDGVASTGFPGVLLIAEGEPLPDALSPDGLETDDPAAQTQEHLLISVGGEVFPWVDFGAEEEAHNPDGKEALDSNPNSVIVVDPTPEGEVGDDEYALVADAGANTVWKVDPDFTDLDENDLPRPVVSVFASFPADDDLTTPEFVPSSLDQDEYGNIYVGGVGSLVPGVAEVVRFSADGEETGRWGGFTGINGLAVDEDGEHVYVSQIVGSDANFDDPLSGSVVRFDTEEETYTLVEIPRPSGLALGEDAAWMNRRHHDDEYRSESGDEHGDHHGRHHLAGTVFVSAFSQSTAEGDPAVEGDGGQVQRFTFPKHDGEDHLPVTEPGTGGGGEPTP
jgi:DNA-binding beta-propeller fold protein YncE